VLQPVVVTNKPQGTSVQNKQFSSNELFVIVFILVSFDMHLLRHTPHSLCKGFIGLGIRRGLSKPRTIQGRISAVEQALQLVFHRMNCRTQTVGVAAFNGPENGSPHMFYPRTEMSGFWNVVLLFRVACSSTRCAKSRS